MTGPASCVQGPLPMGVCLCPCGSFMSIKRSRRSLINPKVSTSSEAHFSNEMCMFAPMPGPVHSEEFKLNGLCLWFHSVALVFIVHFSQKCVPFSFILSSIFTLPICTRVERFLSFRQCLSLKACSWLSSSREPGQQGLICSLHIFCYFYSRWNFSLK